MLRVNLLSDRPKMFDFTTCGRDGVLCPTSPERDVVASSRIARSRIPRRADGVVFERLYWASVAAIVALSAALLSRVHAAAAISAFSVWTAYGLMALALTFSTSALVRSRKTMPLDASRMQRATRVSACERARIHVRCAQVLAGLPASDDRS